MTRLEIIMRLAELGNRAHVAEKEHERLRAVIDGCERKIGDCRMRGVASDPADRKTLTEYTARWVEHGDEHAIATRAWMDGRGALSEALRRAPTIDTATVYADVVREITALMGAPKPPDPWHPTRRASYWSRERSENHFIVERADVGVVEDGGGRGVLVFAHSSGIESNRRATADILVAPSRSIEDVILRGSNIAAARAADDCVDRYHRGPMIATVETALAAVRSILAPRETACE